MPDSANDPLIAALKSDAAAEVVRELNAGRTLTERFHFGRTPLHVAAESGATECVRLLTERGALLEARDDAGHSPLISALGAGHAETAALLIELGARLSYRHTPEDSPAIRERLRRDYEAFTAASRAAHPVVCRLLDEASSDIDPDAFQNEMLDNFVTASVSPSEIHAVHHCATLEVLQLFAQQPGKAFDLHDGAGYWPLKSFAESGDEAAVEWLLGHGASPDFTTTGDTALHAAVAGNQLGCARLLLEAGANPNQQDVDGCVPMWGVASDAMLDLLLAHGADPNIGDQCDFKPSHWVKNPKLKSRLHALERKSTNRNRT